MSALSFWKSLSALGLFSACWTAAAAADPIGDLAALFAAPPAAARPHAMWMWMGTNLSRSQITTDLTAMQEAGIGGTLMFSLADTTTPWPGHIAGSPTPGIIAFTPPWWDLIRHTAAESHRLGLEFGMASSPGYSTSGGPWITPELSMLEIGYTATAVTGGQQVAVELPQPVFDPHANMQFPVHNPVTMAVEKPEIAARRTFYRDIATLAMPTTGVVPLDQVVDLSGKKTWDAPPGAWTIYRFGYTTKGILLQPPQWQANGLECDKLSPQAVGFHLDHVLGELRSHLGDLIGHGFDFIHIDSYEAGVPEWTPRMPEEFKSRRGYDPIPFLAVRAKRVIGSAAQTKKYNADFADTVRDLFRDVYYATFREKLHAAGLAFASEPYGGLWRKEDIVPQVDRVLAEFWTKRGIFQFDNADVVAALRKMGRGIMEAEAFTGWPTESAWSEYPAWLKPIGDGAFCAGINRLVLHRMVSQPWADRFRPGNAMGQRGTHFDRTQTWWEPGKAMIAYWQRCQALLQWGAYAGGRDDVKVVTPKPACTPQSIHRRSGNIDLYFLANTDRAMAGTISCSFAVSGRQPEWWDPVTGQQRDLPEFSSEGGRTIVPLTFAPTQSGFVVFRGQLVALPAGRNHPDLTPGMTLGGPWEVAFDPQWGGPARVTFDKLVDWTARPEPGIRYYSGTATYRCTFDTAVAGTGVILDLGDVNHIARVRLNGQDLGVVWCAPWQAAIPAGCLMPTGNRLEIEVTNEWANRLIGDEQEPSDCTWLSGQRGNGVALKEFPEWFRSARPRPSPGRFCFTTWNYFTKSSPLLPSGLGGPVRIMVPAAGH